MTEVAATPLVQPEERRADIRRLMLFFALAYAVDGICQSDGLIAQPLTYYLKQVYQWTPVQITAFVTVLNVPWFLMPFYGMVSDFVPLLGYRRKSWLLLTYALTVLGYLAILGVAAPGTLIFWLLLTAYGVAIANTLCGALLVEKGQKLGSSTAFVNQEWLWFNVATIGTSILGGQLIQGLQPLGALQWAAAIAAIAPVAVMFACVFVVDEEKSAISTAGLKASARGLFEALQRRELWVIALFLLFYNFSPGLETPLYFYQTDHLKFSQAYIGALEAIDAAGGIAAALIYDRFLSDMNAKSLLNLSILAGVLGILMFLFLLDPVTAAVAHFCYGASTMIAIVATLGMAADHCPAGSEGFAFAALVSITNLAGSLADNVGSFLYERVFHDGLYPLILVAAAFTAVNFVLVPFLNLGPPAGRSHDAHSQISA